MRLFIAVDFNELRDYFAELQKLLPINAKLTLADDFHITLKFLGEVQPDNVDEIIGILKKLEFAPFSVFLDSIGVFPDEDCIRVVWAGINPENKIVELQKSIDESLSQLFKKEKDFKAHITLARVKYAEDKKLFLEQLRKINIENKKIEINNFRLIRSTLTKKSPVYEDLAIFS